MGIISPSVRRAETFNGVMDKACCFYFRLVFAYTSSGVHGHGQSLREEI